MGLWVPRNVPKKNLEKAILLRGWDSLLSYFSMNKAFGTGYDKHLLCAMIADHVSLLAIFLHNFWTTGCF